LGNRSFLPLFPTLWFAAARPLPRRWLFLPLLLAAPFVLPLWLQSARGPEATQGQLFGPWRSMQRLLPYETTQLTRPGEAEATWGELRVRTLNPFVWPVKGAPGSLRWVGGREADLLLASPVPLTGLRLRLSPEAPARVDVSGVELTGTMLRPDGRVDLLLAADDPKRVHPAARAAADLCYYEIRLSLREAPTRPLAVSVEVDRKLGNGGPRLP
jgi:hypothetical protein